MKITLVIDSLLPALLYGGTQRVVWALGKALAGMGHDITMLCARGSSVPFARTVGIDPSRPLAAQIPADSDVVHFQDSVPEDIVLPYIVTINGNRVRLTEEQRKFSVYVSRNHALRNGCRAFVYNGLDWEAYPVTSGAIPPMDSRRGFHFLGKAAWRVKNVKGAINVALNVDRKSTLEVLGGDRLNFKMGFRFTLSPRIHFHGMADDSLKTKVISASRGLIFPVRWEEPFGLAVTESLYLGAPVFATPYGSLPELVTPEVGYLTASSSDMATHIREQGAGYDPVRCHEYAADLFGSRTMAEKYLKYYEEVINGHPLNPCHEPLKSDGRIEKLYWE